jgi:exonuclease III
VNFVFWNVEKKSLESEITQLAIETKPDFLVLAEYKGDQTKLLKQINHSYPYLYAIPSIGCDRITIFSSFSPGNIQHRRDQGRFTIKELLNPGNIPLLLGMVHLPSKLHYNNLDQLNYAMTLRNEIEQAEKEAGHRNTVIFGDFNMNPFDDGMLFSSGMHAISCLTTAERESRVVQGQEKSFFYNPSWNLLGDFIESPGTYFHKSPTTLALYWNTLDQVIMRPSLARFLDQKSLGIIRSLSCKSLVSSNGVPSVSDHLPIKFSLGTKIGG